MFGDKKRNKVRYLANKLSLAGRQGQYVAGQGGAVMWLGRGDNAQKTLYQSILCHLEFCINNRPTNLPTEPLPTYRYILCQKLKGTLSIIKVKYADNRDHNNKAKADGQKI